MSGPEDIRLLVIQCFDGEISVSDLAELDERLRDDEKARRLLVETAVDTCLVRELLRPEAVTAMEADGPVGHTRHRRRLDGGGALRIARWRGTRWGLWISIAACLAIIVGAHLINLWQTEQFVEVLVAHIQETAPNVKVIRGSDGRVVAAIVGMELFPGDRIEAKRGEKMVFGYPNEATTVTVGGGKRESALVIGTVEKSKRLHLEKGMIDALVAPQPADRHMVIETPHAKAEIVGTRFRARVDRETSHATWLHVDEGLVEFTRLSDEKAIDVGAGHFAIAGAKAGDYALKAYTKGTEWVDGPILFQDDFEGGLNERNWEIQSGLVGAVATTPVPNDVRNNVEIVSVARAGGDSRVLEIKGPGQRDRLIQVMLKESFSGASYSLEYSWFMVAEKGVRYGEGAIVGEWIRVRKLWVIHVEPSGGTSSEILLFRNGQFVGRDRNVTSANAPVGFLHRGKGASRADNVVIRRLLRVKGERVEREEGVR